MNQFFKKHIWLAAMVISVSASAVNADDLFDDSFFADPAPVDAVKPADTPKTDAPAQEETNKAPADVQNPEAAPAETPTMPEPAIPAPEPAEPQLAPDIPAPVSDPAPSLSMDVPPPPANIPAPTTAPGLTFDSPSAGSMNLSTPPSEQILGKVSSDIFREMAEMVARECAGGRIGVRIEAEEDPSRLGYAPTLHMNLDTSRLRSLGWKPVYGLADAYGRMMKTMEK